MTNDSTKLDEMIEVLQSAKDGKVIQVYAGGVWQDLASPVFHFGSYKHRVKPEPREWWIGLHPSLDSDTVCCQIAKATSGNRPDGCTGDEFVLVREVLK